MDYIGNLLEVIDGGLHRLGKLLSRIEDSLHRTEKNCYK